MIGLPRAAVWLVRSLWALCASLAALGVYFAALNGFDTSFSPYVPNSVVGAFGFSTVGALLASRRPGNPMGWLLLASGLLWGLTVFGGEYGYAFTSGARPGGLVGLWLGSWTWLAAGSVLLFAFLLFPDGRLPSPRWRVVAWLYVLVSCLQVAPFALGPGPLVGSEALGLSRVANPLGVEAVAMLSGLAAPISLPLAMFTGLTPAAALFVRYRRAGGIERQQVKWVAYAVALLAGAATAVSVWPPLDGNITGMVLFLAGFLSVPSAIGIAILRYRLYDIDRIVNLTLVYGALTVALVVAYLGGVVSLQYLFRFLAGGGSQLAVVASTLVIAALFNPLRRRIQDAVDRRFYRQKYDARGTLEAFNATLRHETDLDSLSHEVLGVVRDTVRPQHASLWMRPPPERRKTFETLENPFP